MSVAAPVKAAGTSEGVRKAWMTRTHGMSADDHAMAAEDLLMDKGPAQEAHWHAHAASELANASGSKSDHASAARAHKAAHARLFNSGQSASDKWHEKWAEHDHLASVHAGKSGINASDQASYEVVRAEGTSEGAKKGWEHRTRGGASMHLKQLRKQGFRGKASIEHDPRKGVWFVRKEEGELAGKREPVTPYDDQIRRMKKYGTQDMHGALTDHIYSDKQAREEFEGDSPGASWEDAAADLAHHYLAMHKMKASDHEENTEVVRAAGTSEGAKKGWEHRARSAFEMGSTAYKHSFRALTPGDHHVAANAHKLAAEYHESAAEVAEAPNDDQHLKKAAEHRDEMKHHLKMAKPTQASDSSAPDVVHSRASGASAINLGASEPWEIGKPTSFMWMPAGVHTINAGFRNGSIELTIKCDDKTAQRVAASLAQWRAERPRQEPFGCIEHREHEASVRVSASCDFTWKDDGVYLAAEPTKLGADNVNGKVHRSWSPSFTTDAEYHKATDFNGTLRFPDGVRGSRSNPAEITGVDFCVGTLTNKPAFIEMKPVKASETGTVTAEGNSEGAKKGWEHRARLHDMILHHSDDANYKSRIANGASHAINADALHKDAAEAHQTAAKYRRELAAASEGREKSHHLNMADEHEDLSNRHFRQMARFRGSDKSDKLSVVLAREASADAVLAKVVARNKPPVVTIEKINEKYGKTRTVTETPDEVLARIYERTGTVKAAGTSDGAKKGWEKRGRIPHQEAFQIFNKTVGSGSSNHMADKLSQIDNPTHQHVSDIVRKEWGPHIALEIEQNFHRKYRTQADEMPK